MRGARLLLAALSLAVASAASEWEPMAAELGLSRSDLDIRPGRWDTPFALEAVEKILEDPLSGPPKFAQWDAQLEKADSVSAALEISARLLQAESSRSTGPAEAL